MRTSVHVVKSLGAVAAIYVMIACVGGGDPTKDGLAPPSSASAIQPVSQYPWTLHGAGDLSHDGSADAFWTNAEQNLMTVWLMSGTRALATGPVIPGPTGEGWSLTAAGDFNQDNMFDLLWYNAGRNLMIIWLMNGTRPLVAGPVIPGPSGDGWSLMAAGDFNRDGRADVTWYNLQRNLVVAWLMDGTRLLATGPVIPGPSGDGWIPRLAFDFNRDGMGDLLWNNRKENAITTWLMNGTRPLAAGPVIPGPSGDGWDAIVAFDYSSDGLADVLWHNSEQNLVAVWLMHGTQLLVPGPVIPGPSGGKWILMPSGDLSGEGRPDVLWQLSGGSSMVVWLMNATQLLVQGPVLSGPPM